jgi:NAD-dependent deacetylase
MAICLHFSPGRVGRPASFCFTINYCLGKQRFTAIAPCLISFDRSRTLQYDYFMNSLYSRVGGMLRESRRTVALTGAGISAESGIPTFRNDDGLWKKYDPAIYASYEVFLRDPSKNWEMQTDLVKKFDTILPNSAHKALAELESIGMLHRVITQNIDALHTKAGNNEVIEIHGNLEESYCLECDRQFLVQEIPDAIPPLCPCGGVIKPSTVLFGEPMPKEAMEQALLESRSCDLMLVIGTSATVQPAASLPIIASEHGARLVEINPEPAMPHADLRLPEKAGRALTSIVTGIR